MQLACPDPKVRAFYVGGKLPALAATAGVGAAINYLMIHAMHDDDEREKILAYMRERPDEERLSTFAVAGKVRLPFDYGVIGSVASYGWNSVEQRLLRADIDGKKEATELLRRARDLPMPTDTIHPPVKTGVELWYNHSFFYDDEIVPDWMQAAYPYSPEQRTLTA